MPRIPSRITSTGAASQQRTAAFPAEYGAPSGTSDGRAALATQRAAASATQSARSLPFGDGNLFADVAFIATVPTVIAHRLGRAYQGFLVLRQRAAAAFVPLEQAQAPSSLDAKQITLLTAVDATADVWVY